MRIGIDLGGTKIEGIVLAPDGFELARERVPTPQGDYRGTLAAVTALVNSLEDSCGRQCPVGIGMPGSWSRAECQFRVPERTAVAARPGGHAGAHPEVCQ